MAEQRYDSFERRAIWEAHGKRCAYCGQPLSFAELQIDHILPRALLKDDEQWDRIRGEQGLPAEFNLLGYENVQPSCRACNERKSAQPFPSGRTAIELGVARRTKGQIEALIKRFKKADQNDKLRFAIAGAIESGHLSEHEIALALSAARVNAGIFRLSATFQLFGDQPVGEISKADYERYLGVRLSLPSGMPDGLRLVSDDKSEVRVFTLREFQEARANGFYACSNFEMQVASQTFKQPLAILHILRTAKLAERSFIDEPRVGLADISLLPATLLFVTEDMTSDENFAGQRTRLKGKSIQDMVDAGEAKVTDLGSDVLAIEYDHGRTFMFEIMRADMDGDGVQDMLIHWGAGPVDGTYRSGSVVVLTRRSRDEWFSTVAVAGLRTAR
jgi:hypothetical protein